MKVPHFWAEGRAQDNEGTFFTCWRSYEDDAERAVACAVAMQLAMASVNAQNKEQGFPEIQMGIAVNTGEVVVGNIGSQKRSKYGVKRPKQ